MTRLYFGAGREVGITPGDLVGAIANEAGLSSKDIGAIEITERFALVDVIEEAGEHVLEVMQDCRIKGRKIQVRLDRGPVKNRG